MSRSLLLTLAKFLVFYYSSFGTKNPIIIANNAPPAPTQKPMKSIKVVDDGSMYRKVPNVPKISIIGKTTTHANVPSAKRIHNALGILNIEIITASNPKKAPAIITMNAINT